MTEESKNLCPGCGYPIESGAHAPGCSFLKDESGEEKRESSDLSISNRLGYFNEEASFKHARDNGEEYSPEEYLIQTTGGLREVIPDHLTRDDIDKFNEIKLWEIIHKIDDFEDTKKKFGEELFAQYEKYWFLRQSLGNEEIRALIAKKDAGNFSENLAANIRNERTSILSLVEKPENIKAIISIEEGIYKLIEENGLKPERLDKPKLQFVGPEEDLLYRMSFEKEISGFYENRLAFVVVKITQAEIESGKLSNATLNALGHELWHHQSAEPVHINAPFEQFLFEKVGLSVSNASDDHKKVHNVLNEGATELLARITADRLGIYEGSNYGTHPYDTYVNLVMNLGEISHDQLSWDPSIQSESNSYKEIINTEALKQLLKDYISLDGLLNLGRRIEKDLGKYSEMIMEYYIKQGKLEEFLDFAFNARLYIRSGLIPGNSLKFPNHFLFSKEYGISYEELRENYPFLKP